MYYTLNVCFAIRTLSFTEWSTRFGKSGCKVSEFSRISTCEKDERSFFSKKIMIPLKKTTNAKIFLAESRLRSIIAKLF